MKRHVLVFSAVFAFAGAGRTTRASNMPPDAKDALTRFRFEPRTDFDFMPSEEYAALAGEISRQTAARASKYSVLPMGHVAHCAASLLRDGRIMLALSSFDGSTRRIVFARADGKRAGEIWRLLADPEQKKHRALLLPSSDPAPGDQIDLFDASRRPAAGSDDALVRR